MNTCPGFVNQTTYESKKGKKKKRKKKEILAWFNDLCDPMYIKCINTQGFTNQTEEEKYNGETITLFSL